MRLVSLDELLAKSDYISLHLPKTEESAGMLGKEAFGKMKAGVRIINCARGGIIDEKALYAGAHQREGRRRGAGRVRRGAADGLDAGEAAERDLLAAHRRGHERGPGPCGRRGGAEADRIREEPAAGLTGALPHTIREACPPHPRRPARSEGPTLEDLRGHWRLDSRSVSAQPGTDLEKWAVIACDQFTSEPEYWRKVRETVGEAPSTLKMVFPEIYLEQPGKESESEESRQRCGRTCSGPAHAPRGHGVR